MNPLPLLIALAYILIAYAIIIPPALLIHSHLTMRQRQRNALRSFIQFRNPSNP